MKDRFWNPHRGNLWEIQRMRGEIFWPAGLRPQIWDSIDLVSVWGRDTHSLSDFNSEGRNEMNGGFLFVRRELSGVLFSLSPTYISVSKWK